MPDKAKQRMASKAADEAVSVLSYIEDATLAMAETVGLYDNTPSAEGLQGLAIIIRNCKKRLNDSNGG